MVKNFQKDRIFLKIKIKESGTRFSKASVRLIRRNNWRQILHSGVSFYLIRLVPLRKRNYCLYWQEIILTNSFPFFLPLLPPLENPSLSLMEQRVHLFDPEGRNPSTKLFPELYAEEKIYSRLSRWYCLLPLLSRPIVPAPEVSFLRFRNFPTSRRKIISNFREIRRCY